MKNFENNRILIAQDQLKLEDQTAIKRKTKIQMIQCTKLFCFLAIL